MSVGISAIIDEFALIEVAKCAFERGAIKDFGESIGSPLNRKEFHHSKASSMNFRRARQARWCVASLWAVRE
jgi:hypothetical protein